MRPGGAVISPALGRQRLDDLQQQGQAGPQVRAVLQRRRPTSSSRDQVGVSPVLFYDPLERVVATLHPDHTFEKVVFDPWQQVKWDANDAAARSRKRTPTSATSHRSCPMPITCRPGTRMRIGGVLGDARRTRRWPSPAHADTPTAIRLDPLGRPVLAVVDNGLDDEGRPRSTRR